MPGSWDEESKGFQLWINLKSDMKMCDPQYQEYTKDKIPSTSKDGATVKVIAGESLGVSFRCLMAFANPSLCLLRLVVLSLQEPPLTTWTLF
jgi:redox-sensitive bicupin YhaK (pirin superfamily)